jgi:hypothetical protein
MKKIALIAMLLFGIGVATTINASEKPEVKPQAAAPCPGSVFNRTPCPVLVCLSFVDCTGLPVVKCMVVGPGSAVPYTAFTGGCCNSITGVSVQGVPAANPPSPVVPVGGFLGGYVTGNPAPCDKWVVDFASMLPNVVIRP